MPEEGDKNTKLIGWGITERCNLTCPHCYSSATKNSPDELSVSECLRILDSLADAGVYLIGWTGGEPLLRKDLEDMVAYAWEKGGIRSGITTNGVLLNAKRVRSLRKAGIASIQISLDGSTAERNRRMRNASEKQFDRVIFGIKTAIEHGLTVDLAMLLGEENIDDVSDYIELAGRLGVSSIRFCAYVPWGAGQAKEVRDRLSFRKRLGDLKNIVESLRDTDSVTAMFDPAFGPLPPDYRFHTCVSGVDTFYISHNGDVYPCTALLSDRFKVGNLRERSLAELLEDPKMTWISSYPRHRIHGYCKGCRHFPECRGACRGITYAHTGDLDASFPVCLKQAELTAVRCPGPGLMGEGIL